MKKLLIQVLLIILVSLIGITSVFITNVEASQASLSAGSVNVGDNLQVTLNLPSNAIGAQADITVKFADGKTKSGKIAYMNGLSSNSVSFSTSDVGAGAATISASNIVISDSSGNAIENGGSTSTSVNIGGGQAPAQTTPAATDTSSSGGSQKDSATKTTVTTTTKAPVKNPSFRDINEQVYASVGLNVRSSCTTDTQDNILGGLVPGQEVTRTGNAEGWSRILYNGKPAYVASRLLTTEKPEETPEENPEEETENTEEQPEKSELELLKENVGVLPEVGNNVATIMYIAFTVLTMITCGIILVYLYKRDI